MCICVYVYLFICVHIGTAGQDQQLDFYISDGQCYPEQLYTSSLYCREKLDIVVPVAGIILLHGLVDMTDLSTSDKEALTFAISSILGSTDSLFVSYQIDKDNMFHALRVEFNVEVPTAMMGYDGSDPDNLFPAYQTAAKKLGDGFESGQFVTLIEQYAAVHVGEALDMVNHGFVELEALNEGVLRDHTGWTHAPSPFYQDLPTSAPSKVTSSLPTSSGQLTSSKSKQMNHHHTTAGTTNWVSNMMISAAVVGVGLFVMFYLRNESPSVETEGNVRSVSTKSPKSSSYRQLATESVHDVRGAAGGGSEMDDGEGDDLNGHEAIKKILLAVAAETENDTTSHHRFSRVAEDDMDINDNSDDSDDSLEVVQEHSSLHGRSKRSNRKPTSGNPPPIKKKSHVASRTRKL